LLFLKFLSYVLIPYVNKTFFLSEMLFWQLSSCPTTTYTWGPQPFSIFLLSFLACLGLRARKKKVGCPPGTTFSDVQITSLVYYICLFGHIWHNRIKMLFYYYFKKLRIYRENNYLPYPCFLDTHVLVLD
jgi:hypothetical protein